MELFDCIEVFYNQRRRHTTLWQISPQAFERRAASGIRPVGWNVAGPFQDTCLMRALLDGTINEAVYNQSPPRPRVTVAPMLDRERVAFIGRVRS